MANIYKGDVSAQEQVGSRMIELGGQTTVKVKGPAGSAQTVAMAAVPGTHYVISRRTTPVKGGLEECVVVFRRKAQGGGGIHAAAGQYQCFHSFSFAV